MPSHHGSVSDVPPESRPIIPPEPDPTPTEQLPESSRPQRFRDRLWSLRAVIAVALASVIVGGLAGAALANIGDEQDGRRGPGIGRFGPGGPQGNGPGGQRWHWGDGPQRQRPPSPPTSAAP
jgi:hypothetical protein